MPHGHHLTPEQIEQIKALRADGHSCAYVARVIGCHQDTVQHHAPGYPGKVPVAPLREAFLASGHTAADVARELGWWARSHGRAVADVARVRRALGLLPDIAGGTGRRSYRTVTDAETVERIAYAIGRMPWEFMPDDEEDAA